MNTCVKSVASWKWASWVYTQKGADTLDSFQKCLCSHLWRIEPLSDEGYIPYLERQRRNSKLVSRDLGLWSEDWAGSVVAWWDHVSRNRCEGWSKPISAWNTSTWLDQQRAQWAPTFPSYGIGKRNRTGTRLLTGGPSRRWAEGAIIAEAAAIASGHPGFETSKPQ